jgi:hypothetical protein
MNDEFILLLDHLQDSIQEDNKQLRLIYEEKQKTCLEYIKHLKRHNKLLSEIKMLHIFNKQQNRIIIKAIHAMFKALQQDHNVLKRDHSLFSELFSIWMTQNEGGNKKLENLMGEIKSRQHSTNINLGIPNSTTTHIKAGNQTQQLNVTSIGGNNKQ